MHGAHRVKLSRAINTGATRCSQVPVRLVIPRSNYTRNASSTVPSFSDDGHSSIWDSLVPKFLRQPKKGISGPKSLKRKEWNPATFYIVMFMLIGSNAINMIALRHDILAFSRKSDAKIALLQDVLRRVQQGEKVDVERLLGTGDPEKEQEWADVLKEIEDEDRLWRSREDKKAKREERAAERKLELEKDSQPIDRNDAPKLDSADVPLENSTRSQSDIQQRAKFY